MSWAKLAALIPPPRRNIVRYHGILAPDAHDRGQVVYDLAVVSHRRHDLNGQLVKRLYSGSLPAG